MLPGLNIILEKNKELLLKNQDLNHNDQVVVKQSDCQMEVIHGKQCGIGKSYHL